MSKSPAFQFYAAEYLSDENVQVMSLQQEGIYLRALCFCWREGSIPKDPAKFRALVGKPENVISDEDLRVVQGCFNQHPTDVHRMVHKRLENEREKQRNWREKSSAGGQKSASKRAKKAELKGGSTKSEGSLNTSSSSSSSSSIPPNPQKTESPAAAPVQGIATFKFVQEFFQMTIVNYRGERDLKEAVEAFLQMGAGEAEIRRRAKVYQEKFQNMPLTANALIRNWKKLEPPPAGPQKNLPSAAAVLESLGGKA